MNLNPLFWVNELKEIGQSMKATGPIMSILWCITCQHPPYHFVSLSWSLGYSLIIPEGLKFRELIAQTVLLGRDSLSLTLSPTVPSHLALCQLPNSWNVCLAFQHLFKLCRKYLLWVAKRADPTNWRFDSSLCWDAIFANSGVNMKSALHSCPKHVVVINKNTLLTWHL